MFNLKNGNSVELLKLLPDECIDLIASDIPYKCTSRGSAGTTGGMMQKDINKKGKVFKHNDINIKDYAGELFRILKNGTHCYIMINHINLIEVLNVMTSCGFHFTKSLIWSKGNKIMGQTYMSEFEYILFFRKGTFKKINNCGTSDILQVPNKKTKGADGKNLHDTEKPVELMKILIENSTQKNDIVLDPFMGIGSTGVASIECGRKFIGIEIDENYFSIAKARIENAINYNSGE